MVEHLLRQGWVRDQIIMIDRDAGISGTKKITERPGMSYLFTLIENGEIGLVASQDVDRFFRDVTQIQTNIFIDACRRNNVLVLTPTFVYDFAHPTQGRYHMQMFRDHAQRAADHLEYHIKGRLMQARDYLTQIPHRIGSMSGTRSRIARRSPRLTAIWSTRIHCRGIPSAASAHTTCPIMITTPISCRID
jgi:hypothetical protein